MTGLRKAHRRPVSYICEMGGCIVFMAEERLRCEMVTKF
jgi:hypothetical protein